MLRKFKFFFFVGVILLSALSAKVLLAPAKIVSKECEFVFSKRLYESYREQLKAYIQDHAAYEHVLQSTGTFEFALQQLISNIEEPAAASAHLRRMQHETFVRQLRQIASSPEIAVENHDNPSKSLFADIINWIYQGPDLTQQVETLLYSYIAPPSSEENIFTFLTKGQKQLHRHMKAIRQKQKGSVPEDHYLAGNLPFGIALEGVQFIRVAQPLIGNEYLPYRLSGPSISPEFKQFLKQQSNHLYINLMRRYKSEGALSAVLENMELELPQVSVVTLDKDSDFYWQREKTYPERVKFQSFKKQFLEKLNDSQGNFHWTSHLDLPRWQLMLEEVIDETQQKYFPNQVILTRNERQDFIELTYLAIINALVAKIQPETMNISCRQTMDRGPSLMALWMWQQGQLNSRQLASVLLAPPLIVHQRTSHSPRIDRLVSAAQRLQ